MDEECDTPKRSNSLKEVKDKISSEKSPVKLNKMKNLAKPRRNELLNGKYFQHKWFISNTTPTPKREQPTNRGIYEELLDEEKVKNTLCDAVYFHLKKSK